MLCKVISTKTVFGNKADVQALVIPEANRGEPQFLYRIVGVITGYVVGTSKFTRTDKETGEVVPVEWTKFAGEFVAINRKGTQYESVICFLPDYIGGPLRQAASEQGAEINIGFDIYAQYSEQSATSYEFIAQPMRSESEQSRVETMMANMPALPGGVKAPQLTGPKKAK